MSKKEVYHFIRPPDWYVLPSEWLPGKDFAHWSFRRGAGLLALQVTEEELTSWTAAGEQYRVELDDARRELDEKLRRTPPLLLLLGIRGRARRR